MDTAPYINTVNPSTHKLANTSAHTCINASTHAYTYRGANRGHTKPYAGTNPCSINTAHHYSHTCTDLS